MWKATNIKLAALVVSLMALGACSDTLEYGIGLDFEWLTGEQFHNQFGVNYCE